MPETDTFDPTHALDGWRPPVPVAVPDLTLGSLLHVGGQQANPPEVRAEPQGFDPTYLLDDWRPPAPAPLDLEIKSLLRAGPVPDEAKRARLKARGYEMLDVEDIELVEASPPRVDVESWVGESPPAPPPNEADPAPPPAGEVTVQAEAGVDLPLPDEEVWPLFMAEAQVLDAGAAPRAPEAEPDPAPAPMAEALEDATAAEVAQLDEAPIVEARAPEPEPATATENAGIQVAEVVPEVEPLAAEAAMPGPGVEPPTERAPPTPVAVDEAPVPEADEMVSEPAAPEPDVQALPPPASPPAPSFADDIQLPPVPSPPAVFEAPVLDFHVAQPPPPSDAAAVVAGIELPPVTAPPAVVEMPQLDIAALSPQPREPDPRLLAHWQAGAWTALTRQIAGASEELLQTPAGLRVESHGSQWLCAIWPPQREDAPLGRWPELACLVAADSTADALQQLLDELPGKAALRSADLEADWDLVAELVLRQDAQLRPAQAKALREFAEAQRNAHLAHLSEGYQLQGRVARRRA